MSICLLPLSNSCDLTATGVHKLWSIDPNDIVQLYINREGVAKILSLATSARVVEFQFRSGESSMESQQDEDVWVNKLQILNVSVAKEILRHIGSEQGVHRRIFLAFMNNGSRMLFGIDSYPDRNFLWEARAVRSISRKLVNEGAGIGGARTAETTFQYVSDYPPLFFEGSIAAINAVIPPPDAPTTDVTAPTAIGLFPAPGSVGQSIAVQPFIQFDEPVVPGAGTIRMYTAAGALVRTWDIATPGDWSYDSGVNRLTLINPSILSYSTSYYFLADSGVVEDVSGNAWGGVAGTSTWTFTTQAAPDVTAPSPTAFFPVDGATSVTLSLVATVTFNEAIQKNGGTINVTRTDLGLSIASLDVFTNSRVTVAGNVLSIDLTGLLFGTTPYAITITSGAIRDLSGNSWAGIAGYTAWNFTTVENIPPVPLVYTPLDGATDADRNTVYSITFDENIQINTGTVEYYEDAVLIRTLTQADTANLYVTAGNKLNIDLEQWSNHNKAGEIRISSGLISDTVGNAWAGLGAGEWNFTVGWPQATFEITHTAQTGFQIGVNVFARTSGQKDLYYHLVIEWGDGTYNNLGTGGVTYAVYTKNYAAPGTYTAKVRYAKRKTGASSNAGLAVVEQLIITASKAYSSVNIKSDGYYSTLNLQNSTTPPVPVTIGTNLNFNNNFFIANMGASGSLAFSGCVLANIVMTGSRFTGFNLTGLGTVPRNIINISFDGNTYLGYANLSTLIAYLKQGSPVLNLRNMGLTGTQVDSYFIDANNSLGAVGAGQPVVWIRLGGTNSAPTAASATARATLTLKGHTVEHV